MDDVKPVSASKSSTVKFSVKVGDQNPEYVGQENEMVQDAMKGIEEIMPKFSFTDYIMFAEVKGHPRKVAIRPSLLCNWLKEGCCIEIEKSTKKTQLTANPKDSRRDPNKETLFFIKTDDRKKKYKMTWIPCPEYKFLELCVSADCDDSFEEALEKDGRFCNVGRFQIIKPMDMGGTSPGIDLKAQDYHRDIFSVSVKRASRKRKACEGNPAPSNDSSGEARGKVDGNYDDVIKQEPTVLIKQEPTEAKGTDVPVPYNPPPVDTLSPSEIPLVVAKFAKSKAYEMLLSPDELEDKKERDKKLSSLVEERFSKVFDTRRPAWLLEKLSSASKSVGRIFFDRVVGTCFLVKKGIVMTNFHVYKYIENAMNNSTAPVEQKKITVWFNHILPHQVEDLREVFVDKVIAVSLDLELDYALLQLEPGPEGSYLDSLDELGAIVRGNVPDDGLLTIIGHPADATEKVEESCRIVSKYLWRDQTLKRVQNLRAPVNGFDNYLFSCKERVMSADYNHKVAYDTSLTYGASGSPCINQHGHIIAMHTSGIIEDGEWQQRFSVIEFGISFKAIYADLKERQGSLADELFPELGGECPMQIN